MVAEQLPTELAVHVAPMRRRHLRAVLRIEAQVYPRPWSASLFLSELALRSTRAYYVARVGRDVVGYAGLMMTAGDGHVTTIAVHPRWHRHRIGTRLLLALARDAVARGAGALTLEVRLSNKAAQHLYRRFGFRAELASERLAPLHAPFRTGYRNALARLLREVGAKPGR